MVTLDKAFFPHIFDTIFEFAEYEALLRLRLTCRALYARIDHEWGHIRWNVGSNGQPPDKVYNKRGALVSSRSSCLRLTKVLDLNDEFGYEPSPEVPDHLRPVIIRYLSMGDYAMSSHAETLILFNPYDVAAVHPCVRPPARGRHRLIYRLDFGDADPCLESIGDIPWPADVYLLFSGCPRVSGPVETICRNLMGPPLPGNKRSADVDFYFVDVLSWFDTRGLGYLYGEHERLDIVLTNFETFYGLLLDLARREAEEAYDGWWPSPAILQRLARMHCISRAEMRERVGDKAYELTFAAQDIHAPASQGATV